MKIDAKTLPRILLRPVPLFPVQPLLSALVRSIGRDHPEIFARLGRSRTKRFLIDPVNMPFVFLLVPNPEAPTLRCIRRGRGVPYDAKISGTFLTLLAMIDAQTDSDALFFSRDLLVEGDTEATVALRNALDDLDTSLVEDILARLGPLRGPSERILLGLRRLRERNAA